MPSRLYCLVIRIYRFKIEESSSPGRKWRFLLSWDIPILRREHWVQWWTNNLPALLEERRSVGDRERQSNRFSSSPSSPPAGSDRVEAKRSSASLVGLSTRRGDWLVAREGEPRWIWRSVVRWWTENETRRGNVRLWSDVECCDRLAGVCSHNRRPNVRLLPVCERSRHCAVGFPPLLPFVERRAHYKWRSKCSSLLRERERERERDELLVWSGCRWVAGELSGLSSSSLGRIVHDGNVNIDLIRTALGTQLAVRFVLRSTQLTLPLTSEGSRGTGNETLVQGLGEKMFGRTGTRMRRTLETSGFNGFDSFLVVGVVQGQRKMKTTKESRNLSVKGIEDLIERFLIFERQRRCTGQIPSTECSTHLSFSLFRSLFLCSINCEKREWTLGFDHTPTHWLRLRFIRFQPVLFPTDHEKKTKNKLMSNTRNGVRLSLSLLIRYRVHQRGRTERLLSSPGDISRLPLRLFGSFLISHSDVEKRREVFHHHHGSRSRSRETRIPHRSRWCTVLGEG